MKIYHKVDDIALVGKPLLDFDVIDEEAESSTSSSSSSSSDEDVALNVVSDSKAEKPDENRLKVLATPAVRRIAMENKVNLSQVKATGKAGRVLKGDVLEYLGQIPPGTNKPHPTLRQEAQEVGNSKPTGDVLRVEVLKGVRKAMMKSMTEALVIFRRVYFCILRISSYFSTPCQCYSKSLYSFLSSRKFLILHIVMK